MKEKRLRILYIFSDIILSMVVWFLFFFFRKIFIEHYTFSKKLLLTADFRLLQGMLMVPLFWFILYYISGYYSDPLRKSRLKDFADTLLVSLLGTMILFFGLILDDAIFKYTNYYLLFSVLFLLQFTLTYIARFIITSRTVYLIQNGIIGFSTLIIGGDKKASSLYNRIRGEKRSTGNIFIGYITIDEGNASLAEKIPHLGTLANLEEIIEEKGIKEVIIAIEQSEKEIIGKIVNTLSVKDVIIKIIPDLQDILMGRVRMSAIFGTPLILLNENPMPPWQANIKQLLDYSGSLFALIITLPVSLILALIIRIESRGPVIFSQERVGRNGKPFRIFKFRSMYAGAETDIPLLSSDSDSRVTKTGRFIRKHRLDEIPNFINVLRGEMSIVGPRPERQYYIDLITEKTPLYLHLLKIKPGITSWGQVKYGYASNVDQMMERLEYDLLYLENMSLLVDLKITIYTFITILKGRGV